MDTSRRSSVTPNKSRIARTFAKVLHARTASGVAPLVENPKKKIEHPKIPKKNENPGEKLALRALLSRIFASVSSIKASYAQLQLSQSPYDADGIRTSDREVVSELKTISELKQCYQKKQLDPFPEKALISAEIQEQKSVLKTYEIMKKKLDSQIKLKHSEIIFLHEKLEELKRENRSMEKRLNSSGRLSSSSSSSVPENLNLSGLNPNDLIPILRQSVRSIRSFVKLMVREMQSAGWDVSCAAGEIQPGVRYSKEEHKCFAFESFVCREMFDDFHRPGFGLSGENPNFSDQMHRRRLFFERFVELRSVEAREYLTRKPKSTFGKFCRAKYLRLVHPKMECSFFGDLGHRNLVNAGEIPATEFFSGYAEMAKRVWLLHCLAFSYESPAMIFQVRRGCRFSEVFMESAAAGNLPPAASPAVAFTVVPGFKVGKSVIQAQVYVGG